MATVEARIFYLQKALGILLESPIRDPKKKQESAIRGLIRFFWRIFVRIQI